MKRFAVYFDLETGGVEERHPDIQLAAIAIDETSWAEVASFETKIAFDPAAADPQALELNHYRAEAWVGALAIPVVVARFTAFLNRFRSLEMVSKRTGRPYAVAKLAGHNAASFDGPRLKRMFQLCDQFLPADPRVRCTCQLAMWWLDARGVHAGSRPPDGWKPLANYQLGTLCEYFGVPIDQAHEALSDVRSSIALARLLTQIPEVAA